MATIRGGLVIVGLLIPKVKPSRVVEGLTAWRSQSHFLAKLLLMGLDDAVGRYIGADLIAVVVR